MRFKEVLSFRKDIFFEGAVQIDWFYNQEKGKKVAENFVFHGSEYFGFSDESGAKRLTDTISFVDDIVSKTIDDQHVNPLTLAIAGYGTGKSHLAVTLAHLLSGKEYLPETYEKIIAHIDTIDRTKASSIRNATQRPNLVLILNGMRDFNLHYELLKAAQKSLSLYGYSDEKLRKLNRAIETAFRFFERNAESSIQLFEKYAAKHSYLEKGEALIARLRKELGEDDKAFDIINDVYNDINGNEIRWDEGVSAGSVLDTLLSEYCGISGQFNRIVIIFDEFGRYLEYASSTSSARSGDSALQQIFECAQNAEGGIQVINFIQSDIKSYLQRVDQTSNISRYIGRYDASDKYYLSSNLETVFANLIQRDNKAAFDETIKCWQTSNESNWKYIYEKINTWLPAKGVWKDYSLFRRVVVEGIYPLHPLSTYMLSQLSDYLQNRSSLMLLGRYVDQFADEEIDAGNPPLVYPETLLEGDLFIEMLSAEEEGRQYSQHCIRYNNVLRKYGDKLSENSKKILRANLALRILRCHTSNYDDVKEALEIFTGLNSITIDEELVWLENEYAVLGYDDHSCCFDFLEDSSGAHDFKTFFKRVRANTSFANTVLDDSQIREWADVINLQPTNFATNHKIKTNEWQFEQDLFSIGDLSIPYAESCIRSWREAISPDKVKGKIIWLYANRDTTSEELESAKLIAASFTGMPIVLMLLDDAEDRLKNALCDYLAVQTISDADRQKLGRHFIDKLQQIEDNVKNAFDLLKKQRIQITDNGIVSLETRLAVSLTNVFDTVYPQAIPFDFDGFDSKQPGKARKAFCSIARLLLSGPISENTIHSFPADVRNRLESTLSYTGAYSWKIINTNYQIIPPENKAVLEVYNEIVEKLPEGSEIKLDDLINKLVAPPYGMNDYISVYMIVAICANLSYCLRVVLNGAVYSINAWKEEVIQDNKVDLAQLRKSTIKRVNAGAVADRFLRLFAKIDNNLDFSIVGSLSNELEAMKQSEDIPDELAAQYQLALNKLQEGNRVKSAWDSVYNSVMEKLDALLDRRDIYCGLQALQLLNGTAFYNCFSHTSYAMVETQQETLKQLKGEIKNLVDPFISGWISEQRCKGVESISQFKKHMERLQNLLNDLGYFDAANAVAKRALNELSNVEEIRARQELRSNYSDFMQNCVVTPAVPYIRLLEWKKQGEVLLENIQKFAPSLGKDYERLNTNTKTRIDEINSKIERIKQDMNDIYDDIYSISSIEDVNDMISRIQKVCQLGIPNSDLSDFEELKKTLVAFVDDVSVLEEYKDNRAVFKEKYSELSAKYDENELDFDVLSILKQVADAIIENLNKKDLEWRKKYVEISFTERSELLRWIDDTRVLPLFISEETISLFSKQKKTVEKALSKAKIDDVVYSFIKLEDNEKAECFDKLVELFNKGETIAPDEKELSHTKNKKWDLEEWIVLVKLYFENKDKSRSEMLSELAALSELLIRRADKLGIEHDEKYRNINGLAMQFDRIKYLDTDGAKGLSAYSELAEAALLMYRNNRNEFDYWANRCWNQY